ncbi:MAG: hypothetical protein ACK4G3_03090 [bacterium]
MKKFISRKSPPEVRRKGMREGNRASGSPAVNKKSNRKIRYIGMPNPDMLWASSLYHPTGRKKQAESHQHAVSSTGSSAKPFPHPSRFPLPQNFFYAGTLTEMWVTLRTTGKTSMKTAFMNFLGDEKHG